jgi:hypothetical protein
MLGLYSIFKIAANGKCEYSVGNYMRAQRCRIQRIIVRDVAVVAYRQNVFCPFTLKQSATTALSSKQAASSVADVSWNVAWWCSSSCSCSSGREGSAAFTRITLSATCRDIITLYIPYDHRLNMDGYLQSLFGLHVT